MKGRMEGSYKEKQCGSRVTRMGKLPTTLGCWGGDKTSSERPGPRLPDAAACSLQPEPHASCCGWSCQDLRRR